MNNQNRRQLTLLVNPADAMAIETIRSRFNPVQHQLIAAHVTLCREDEIENIEAVLLNLQHLKEKSITLCFDKPVRFDDGAGVMLPPMGNLDTFDQLRKKLLAGIIINPRKQQPHITLMHPRNSVCTDAIFEIIQQTKLPGSLVFNSIALIEQVNGGAWKILRRFNLQK